jgi:hypothetical protein
MPSSCIYVDHGNDLWTEDPMGHKILMASVSMLFGGAIIAPAIAVAGWKADHPRRAEVNARLNNQDRRINKELREGEITKGEAHQLHAEDHGIRNEERTMASQNGGHITKTEQRALNQQENGVSKQIGQ